MITIQDINNYFDTTISYEEFNIISYIIDDYNGLKYHQITLFENISKQSLDKLKRKVYLKFGFFIRLLIDIELYKNKNENIQEYKIEKVLIYPKQKITYSSYGGLLLEEMKNIKSSFNLNEHEIEFENAFFYKYSNMAVDSNPEKRRRFF